MISKKVKVIIDYDGTLTYEERDVAKLAKKALKDLAENILHLPEAKLVKIYEQTKQKILDNPTKFSWVVNGLPACYAVEGAFLLNTVSTQTMLRDNRKFTKAVTKFFPKGDYGPIVDCTNYLFHKHTFGIVPQFREKTNR